MWNWKVALAFKKEDKRARAKIKSNTNNYTTYEPSPGSN